MAETLSVEVYIGCSLRRTHPAARKLAGDQSPHLRGTIEYMILDSSQADPIHFPRRILLATTGLSPQVVTETLYALAVAATHKFFPTEIHLVATAEAAEQARLSLLSPDPGWFHRLRSEHGLPPMEFGEHTIHTLRAQDGQHLGDIRTPADNAIAADAITELVRGFTSDPLSAVHCSIAGGRKTLGYYLGYAMSLFGRPQDRLSHVLVSEPFESNREFFFPTVRSRVIADRSGRRMVDAADATVSLAEIPFVSLRHGLPDQLVSGCATFLETVRAARAALGPPELVLDPRRRLVSASGQEVRLPPAELALLAVFARRALGEEEPVAAPPKGVPDIPWAARFLAEYRTIVGPMGDIERTERALAHGMDDDYFSQHLTKLRRYLKTGLGPMAKPYLIDDSGTRPRRYRLAIPAGSIRFTI